MASPFEIAVTKEALQARIDKGDISQADVDILKKGYQWMAISSLVGSSIGIPVFMTMKRRKPPATLGIRLITAISMASLGSFLGFTVGGAAAALEVNNHMEDSGRKMKVFQQVMLDGRKRVEEERLRKISGAAPGDAPSVESAPWASTSTSTSVPTTAPGGISRDVKEETGSTWDHLRAQNFPNKANMTASTMASPDLAGRPVESDREREKREFEALLDKERRGEDDDKWK